MGARSQPMLLLLVSCALATVSAGSGQTTRDGASQATSTAQISLTAPLDTPHLSIRLSTSAPAAAPGAAVTLFVDVTPKPRMHVYAPDQKDYIPVSLTLERDDAIRAARPSYPKPEKYFFEPLKETQLVYSAPFRIAQDVTIESSPPVRERARSGNMQAIKGTLRYQACDDTICYMPKNVPVSWSIRLKP